MFEKDTAIAKFAGTLLSRDERENRTKISIQVDNMTFWLTAWKDEIREKIREFEIGQFISLTTTIKNNDYEKDGEMVYSFNFNVSQCSYSSSKPYSKVYLVGRMAKEMDIRHFDIIEEDFASGTIAANVGNNATFVNFLHKDFNENVGILMKKGLRVAATGIVKISKNGYSFYVNDIEECPIIKQEKAS